MRRPMLEYEKCVKCAWGAQRPRFLHRDAEGEYLDWVCWVCGFGWQTLTADAAQPVIIECIVEPPRLLAKPVDRPRGFWSQIRTLIGVAGR